MMPTLSLPRLQEFYTTRDASRPLSYSHRKEVEKVINLLKYLGVSNDEGVIKELEDAQNSWFPRYHATQVLSKCVTDFSLSQEPDKKQSKWNRLVYHVSKKASTLTTKESFVTPSTDSSPYVETTYNNNTPKSTGEEYTFFDPKKASTLTTKESSVTPSTDSSPYVETTYNNNTPKSTGEEYTFFDPLSPDVSPPVVDTNGCDNSKYVAPIPEESPVLIEDTEIASSPSIWCCCVSDNQATSAGKAASSVAKATSESVDNEGKGLSFFFYSSFFSN
jgi:hypothetical protein